MTASAAKCKDCGKPSAAKPVQVPGKGWCLRCEHCRNTIYITNIARYKAEQTAQPLAKRLVTRARAIISNLFTAAPTSYTKYKK